MLDKKCPICGMMATIARHRGVGNCSECKTALIIDYNFGDHLTVPVKSECPSCKAMMDSVFCFSEWGVICPRCGKYELSKELDLSTLPPRNRSLLSGWVREHQNSTVTEANLPKILETRPPSLPAKAERLMLFLAKSNPKPGTSININQQYSPKESGFHAVWGAGLFAVCWCEDSEEFRYLLYTYLAKEKQFMQGEGDNMVITPQGWSYIESLSQANPNSSRVFVALWFDKSLDPAWMAIETGVKNAGFEPLRIDRKEHNNKIDDEIIAGIRGSRFLVADFTGHRGGVYFEAGFATGLGLPVIWLCRGDDLENLHFDTRQYNFIVWETEKLGDLSKLLQNRIEATIGRGQLVQTP